MNSTKFSMEKVKRGDPETFRDFFLHMYPKLMALACRFVDEQVACDLVQDVFTSWWERKQTVEVENIHAFLFKWVQNNCLNYLKHQAVEEEYASRVRLAEARVAFRNSMSDANDVFEQVTNRELREIVENATKKLPPKCAQAFRLCYFHDMSHKEIARVMDISSRTVEGHIRQAILHLRASLKGIAGGRE
jgi:RNA polymerase sigma-70 factor (ECF subfamily)